MTHKIFLAAGLILLVCSLPVQAQVERYKVGQHLRELDIAWEQHRQDAAGKKRALKHLLPVVPSFFAARWGDAARLLVQARHALAARDEAPAAVRWAESLIVQPDTRLMEKKADRLIVTLNHFYKVDGNIPEAAEVVLQFHGKGKAQLPEVKATIKELPLAVNLPAALPVGDHFLQVRIVVGGKTLTTEEQMISVVDRPRERLLVLKKGLAGLPKQEKNADGETVGYLLSLLEDLANGATFETNYPANRLFAEAEAALSALRAGKSFYGGDKAGQFWLKLPTARDTFVSRLFAPDEVQKGKPLPLVVALHGAGASENLFFEGYGNGLIVQMCQERGWLLVSPRSGYLAFSLPVGAIVEAVSRLYPVDRSKVFVVGHSMGAAQAMGAIQEDPKLFSAIAALGGSAKLTAVDKIKNVPFFVGVGDSDFALEGARRLAQQLKTGGVQNVQFKEYADIEHIMIVREALPDAFALFEKINKKS